MPQRRRRVASHPPVEAIDGLVRCVARRSRQAHMARAICGALAASVTLLAAAVMSGAPLSAPGTLGLAAAIGALVFFAWLRSHRHSTRTVLRAVDERLHLGSQFIAAWEGRCDTPDSAVTQLGVARLLEKVPRRAAMEAAVPHTLGFALLPLLAIFVFVRAIDARDLRARNAGAEVSQYQELAGDLRTLAQQHASELSPDDLAAVEAAAAAVDAAVAASGSNGEKGMQQAAREAADELDDMAMDAPPGSALAEALAEAAAEAEMAALDHEADPGEPQASSPEPQQQVAMTTETELEREDTMTLAESQGAGAAEASDGPGSGQEAGDDASVADAGGESSAQPGAGDAAADGGGASSPDAAASGLATANPAAAEHAPAAADDAPGTAPTAGEPAGLGATRWWSRRDAPIVEAWAARRLQQKR